MPDEDPARFDDGSLDPGNSYLSLLRPHVHSCALMHRPEVLVVIARDGNIDRDIDGDDTLSGRTHDDWIEVKRLETTVVGSSKIAEPH